MLRRRGMRFEIW